MIYLTGRMARKLANHFKRYALATILASVVTSTLFQAPLVAQKKEAPTDSPSDLMKLVDALGADDAKARLLAEGRVDLLPDKTLPQLETLVASGDLLPAARASLTRLVADKRRRFDLKTKARLAEKPDWLWRAKVALNDYEKGLHTNPKWDAAAKAGVTDTWMRGSFLDDAQGNAAREDARKQLDAAVAAGCDDPIVLLCAGIVGGDTGMDGDQVYGYFHQSEKATGWEKINPNFLVIVEARMVRDYIRGYRGGLVKENYPEIQADFGQMVGAFDKLAKVDGVPISVLVNQCEYIFSLAKQVHIQPVALAQHIFPILEKAAPNDIRVMRLKGATFIDLAWFARGTGAGNKLTPRQQKDFQDRLAVAEELLTAAWEKDHTDPSAPTDMLKVELGQGKGRDVMELWFKRAMEADPDNYEACSRKVTYLQPKWYGSPKELQDFGQECLAGGNWHTNIPQIVVLAHRLVSEVSGNARTYYQKSGVWADIDACYTGYLSRYPDDTSKRTSYAMLAYNAAHWEVADAQLQKLGDNVDMELIGNPATLERMKATLKEQLSQRGNQGN